MDDLVAEVVKLSQLPVNAPWRFRRVRSSKGFLPPVEKAGLYTGQLDAGSPLPAVQIAAPEAGGKALAEHLRLEGLTAELVSQANRAGAAGT